METWNETTSLDKQSVSGENCAVPDQSIASIQSRLREKTRRLVEPRRRRMQWNRDETSSSMQYRSCRRYLSSQCDPFRNVALRNGATPSPSIDEVSKRLNAIASPHLQKVWGKRMRVAQRLSSISIREGLIRFDNGV